MAGTGKGAGARDSVQKQPRPGVGEQLTTIVLDKTGTLTLRKRP